jgi:hypothetical protein
MECVAAATMISRIGRPVISNGRTSSLATAVSRARGADPRDAYSGASGQGVKLIGEGDLLGL